MAERAKRLLPDGSVAVYPDGSAKVTAGWTPGSMERPTLVLGALVDHVEPGTLVAQSTDPGAYPVDHLTSRLPRTWWRHPEPVATIDVDLGQPRDVGTVFVGGLNLGPHGVARFWTGRNASPRAQRLVPDTIVESQNLPGVVGDLAGDPTDPAAGPGIDTTGVQASITVGFPTPPPLLAGGPHHVARLRLAEAPGSPDLTTTLKAFRVLDGTAIVATYPADTPALPGLGYHELRFSLEDLEDPSGARLEVEVELWTLGGSTTLVAVDLAVTPASAGPPVEVAAWPSHRTLHGGELTPQADHWGLALDVAHHLRAADGRYGNEPVRYLRVDLDNSAAGVPVEATHLMAGPSFFLGARAGLEYGGHGDGTTTETPTGLDVLLPSRVGRGDRVSVAVGVDAAEAIRELLTLRPSDDAFVVHPTPLRPRGWSMPYLARFAERPQVVHTGLGLPTDRDRYTATFDFQEIRR